MAQLRELNQTDLGDLMALSISANWNQVEADWQRMLRFAPTGCFGMEEDGHIVASATIITYGNDLAWIGMVLTLPEYRGCGFASQLMRRCIDSVDVPCIKLDATDLGRPVYQRLGFVEEYTVQRYRATLPVNPIRRLPHDLDLDRLAFGADRSELLQDLGGARPGRIASYLGPVVCRDAEEARVRLLGAGYAGLALVDVPDTNPAAVTLAQELGFRPFRQLWRMRKGAPINERPDLVYALAGFEFG
ncbi:GNAT family N-acetyltransferase [uncultured Paludibaculum sp.]|uniref:GNAT family N-acetyltransferase n=1 Tax=uncultured Paludibaculum sp. TaxID=1765020 RepID=UPI002AAAEB6B|nr:GNAT family N-acetyltransferase [uncultured Paludibaculum sp.]